MMFITEKDITVPPKTAAKDGGGDIRSAPLSLLIIAYCRSSATSISCTAAL